MSHLLHSSNGYHDRSWSLDNYVAPGTSDTPARVRIEKDQKLHNGDVVADAALYTSGEHSDNFSGSVAMSRLRVHTIISSSTPFMNKECLIELYCINTSTVTKLCKNWQLPQQVVVTVDFFFTAQDHLQQFKAAAGRRVKARELGVPFDKTSEDMFRNFASL